MCNFYDVLYNKLFTTFKQKEWVWFILQSWTNQSWKHPVTRGDSEEDSSAEQWSPPGFLLAWEENFDSEQYYPGLSFFWKKNPWIFVIKSYLCNIYFICMFEYLDRCSLEASRNFSSKRSLNLGSTAVSGTSHYLENWGIRRLHYF